MNTFDVLGENPLKKMIISRFRWYQYGVLNLNAIPLSTKPVVLALAPDTTTNVNAMGTIINLIGLNLTDRGIATFSRNNIYKSFYKDVVDLEYNVGKIFEATPEVYNIEFFSGKLGEYNKAVVSHQGFLINKIKDLTLKYETELGIPTKTLFADYYTDYNTASQNKITKSNKVTKNSADYKNILDLFLDQMWINMLVTAGAYVKEKGVAKTFFHPQVLHAYHYTSSGVLIAKPLLVTIDPESIALCDIAVKTTEKLIVQNPGKKSFFLFSSADLLELNNIPDDALEIEPGDEVMLEGSTLKKYIYVANKETTGKAKAELSLM